MSDESTSNAAYFRDVYMENQWGGQVSRSGPGSEGEFAAQKKALLTQIIADHHVQRIVDIGCGDLHWMSEVLKAHPHLHYLGVDVVAPLIELNRHLYGSQRRQFLHADLSAANGGALATQLPFAPHDLVVALDVFGHLLNPEVDALAERLLRPPVARLLWVTNRRGATDYLQRPKSRLEGIDLNAHPTFLSCAPKTIASVPGLFAGDVFELYQLR